MRYPIIVTFDLVVSEFDPQGRDEAAEWQEVNGKLKYLSVWDPANQVTIWGVNKSGEVYQRKSGKLSDNFVPSVHRKLLLKEDPHGKLNSIETLLYLQ